MVRVTLNGQTLAESDETIDVDGNHYFPPESVDKDKEYLTNSSNSTVCPFKGYVFFFLRFLFLTKFSFRTASYYDAKLGDKTTKDIAWLVENKIRLHHETNFFDAGTILNLKRML